MEPKQAKITLISETNRKELTNAQGEPYDLVELKAKGKKGEFNAVMFLAKGKTIPFNQEIEATITEGRFGGYVVKPLTPKRSYPARVNTELEVWKMALQAASAMGARSIPDLLDNTKRIAQEIKKAMK